MITLYAWWVMSVWAQGIRAEGFVLYTDVPATSYEYQLEDGPWLPVLISRCRARAVYTVAQDTAFECYVTLPKLYYGIDRQFHVRAATRPLVVSPVGTTRLLESLIDGYTSDDARYPWTEGERLPCVLEPNEFHACMYYWPEETNALPPTPPLNPVVL